MERIAGFERENNTEALSQLSHTPENTATGKGINVTLPEFFGAFRKEPAELIHFRAIKAKNCPPHLYRDFDTQNNPPDSKKFLVSAYTKLAPDSENVKTIRAENARRGVYFVVNAGGVKDTEITRFTASFSESDPKHGEAPEEFIVRELKRMHPLPPSVQVITQKSVHNYWLIEGDCTREQWLRLQKGQIALYGSDPMISNEERVMRFPNSNHVRVDFENDCLLYKPVQCVTFEPTRRYTVEQLMKAFPCPPDGIVEIYTKLSGDKYKKAGIIPSDELKAEVEAIKEARKAAARSGRSKAGKPSANALAFKAQAPSTSKTTTFREVIERQKNGESIVDFQIDQGDYSDGEFSAEEIEAIEGTLQRQCLRLANAEQGKKHATLWDCSLIVGGLVNASFADPDRCKELLLEAVTVAAQASGDESFDIGAASATINEAFGKATPSTMDELLEKTWTEVKPQVEQEFCANFNQDIVPLAAEVWKALAKAEEKHPRIFWSSGVLSRITVSKTEVKIEPLTADTLQYRLAYLARWVSIKADKEGNLIKQYQPPPGFLVRHMLAAPMEDTPIPVLKRITDIPVFDSKGTLIDTPGFHRESGIFYNPAFYVEPIPERVTKDDVVKAKELIADSFLADFPFAKDADKHNAIGCLLTPFVREMIEGPTPLFMAEAVIPGSGKSLLIENILEICFGGKDGCETLTFAAEESEMSKRLTSALISGKGGILIDNIRDVIDSAELCTVLTSRNHNGRILGSSRLANVEIRALWTATANNPTFSQEMARRTVSIRLVPGTDRPEERTGFKIDNLSSWVKQNRAALVRASLILCKGWIQRGMPGRAAKNAPIMGSYEDFLRIVGGILETIGYDKFLANRAEFTERADTERTSRALLCHEWFSREAKAPSMDGREITIPMRAGDIWDKVGQFIEGLPVPHGKDPRLMFGHYLRNAVAILPTYLGPLDDDHEDTIIQAQYEIIKSDKKTGGSTWYQVERKALSVIRTAASPQAKAAGTPEF